MPVVRDGPNLCAALNAVYVKGDVNSKIAAALVCSKLMIPTAHVEAGLRSFDRTMPEEINRLLTDQIADLLFTPSADGNENLRREGIPEEKIALVGNVMIDTLVRFLPHAKVAGKLNAGNGCEEILKGGRRFGLVTLHRPSNVDDPEMLKSICNALDDTSLKIPIIFPIHPRTRKRIADCKIRIRSSKLLLTEPLGYIDFLSLQMRAAFVIADSGGIQEETTYIGIPCLTVRGNTERPVTVTMGTNILVGRDMNRLRAEVRNILNGSPKKGSIPPLWDGKASERIADIIEKRFSLE